MILNDHNALTYRTLYSIILFIRIISFSYLAHMQLHLGLDHTKFIQGRLVPSCNMAFLTTRKRLPTVNIHPSVSFYTCWRIQLLTVIIIIPITIIIVLGLLPYITFLPFYVIVLIQT